jgi:hypothetical protein
VLQKQHMGRRSRIGELPSRIGIQRLPLQRKPSTFTVPLGKKKVLISRSCLILVLTAVLCRPRHHANTKNHVKYYQGPTTSGENVIRKPNFPHTFF